MRFKIVLPILAQVFILLPILARDPPHQSWDEQQIRSRTKNSRFGDFITLNDLKGYFTEEFRDKVPKCYNEAKKEYKEAAHEFTENVNKAFSDIKNLFESKFPRIVQGAQTSIFYIINKMREFPDELEKGIKSENLCNITKYVGDTAYDINHFDFEFDISMQKLLQQIHQDRRVQEHDNKVLNIKKEVEKKTKKIMEDLENCLEPLY